MKHIYRAAYVAIALGFIRKLLRTLIPEAGSGMYVFAWHPCHNQPDGVILENMLIVLAAGYSRVTSTGVTSGTRWTVLYLPISKIVAYAIQNDIHYVMPLWSAATLRFHGTPESADSLHIILAQMRDSTSHLPIYNVNRAVDMIRRQIN